ncbi:hypothetical protein V6N11_020616 [Hibiscus sabdariffa]|uniref:Uncharacterized protein n=1 Tax=Hibiscus sabdariffa TaxID=183260 RepID=A0ABR2Q8Y6_9ROSI
MQDLSHTTQDSIVQSSVESLPEHNYEGVASDMFSEEAQTSPHVSADIHNPEVEDTDLVHDVATDLVHDLVEDNQAHGVQNEVIPAVRRSTRAVRLPEWRDAMQDELQAMDNLQTCDLNDMEMGGLMCLFPDQEVIQHMLSVKCPDVCMAMEPQT